MFKKSSVLYSILGHKCPRCHEGDLYRSSIFGGVYNMHKNCPHCGQNFEMEPGFYWGAMYVGYGLSSGYMLSAMMLLIFGFGLTVNQSFVIAILGAIVIVPMVARLARSIWIHIYVRYNPKAGKHIDKHA